MLTIALTGGIGTGKTTVSDIFKSKDILIVDTDIIARKIVEKDNLAYQMVIKKFGNDILDKDKNINRQALRELIFSSEKKRLDLESILHPIIWDEVKSKLNSPEINSPYCIVVVPLLLENKNKYVKFDRILVIDANEKTQIKRTKNRDNNSESIIKNIINSQVSRQVRIDAADDIILNTNNLESLEDKVNELHEKYLKLSS